MNLKSFLSIATVLVLLASAELSQTPAPTPSSQKIADSLAKSLEAFGPHEVPRDVREQAYSKLLEGQRYVWRAGRLQTQAGITNAGRTAKQAFQKAVELDPRLAEGYTALAELALSVPPGDVDESIALAALATKIQPNNFGSHRILGRLFTIKSRLNSDAPDTAYADKAIFEWKEVARLDPRNAEAWAFLSKFYGKQGRSAERIDALNKWLSAAVPVDVRFYRQYMGGDASLTPETASLELGSALIEAGRSREAVEVLSTAISDDPDNYAALDLLRQAVEAANPETASLAAGAVAQAVYANPRNISLIGLLARIQVKSGKFADAVSLLNGQANKLLPIDRPTASALKVLLGDLYNSEHRAADALKTYEESLAARGLDNAKVLADDEREFATQVFAKMIDTLKASDRLNEVKPLIERARKLLGDNDLFADKQLISYFRENGMRPEALSAVKAARARMPSDYGLIRLEATLLTENGKVDEAVSLVKKLMQGSATKPPETATTNDGSTVSITIPRYDDFSNYLFIAQLYTQAGRGNEAAEAANQAYSMAQGSERKQIARLTLATARQRSGDFAGAESTLREILKEAPGNPIALNNLGYFLVERGGNLQEALQLIKQAVAIDPTNPSYLDSLGWTYFQLGNAAEAEKNLKSAAQLDSGSSTIQEHLGDVYQKLGKIELAAAAWKRAISLASDNAEIERIKRKLSGIQ